MSEEVENTEETSAETTEVQSDGSSKKKKVNQLTADELKKKIADMQEKKQTESRYFKHLSERLKEMEK